VTAKKDDKFRWKPGDVAPPKSDRSDRFVSGDDDVEFEREDSPPPGGNGKTKEKK
jgi:hypothetical protein